MGVCDLWGRAPEEDCGEVGDPADMAQRLKDEADRFAAPGGAAIDTNIGSTLQKRGLRSGLSGNRHHHFKSCCRHKCGVLNSGAGLLDLRSFLVSEIFLLRLAQHPCQLGVAAVVG